jgi:hypothetical protein
MADHAERRVAIEIEPAHDVRNGAVHVAAAAGAEVAKEGVKAATEALAHDVTIANVEGYAGIGTTRRYTEASQAARPLMDGLLRGR